MLLDNKIKWRRSPVRSLAAVGAEMRLESGGPGVPLAADPAHVLPVRGGVGRGGGGEARGHRPRPRPHAAQGVEHQLGNKC